jgi:hypothetical protein
MPAQRQGVLSSGALPVPFGRSPGTNSVSNFSRYEVMRLKTPLFTEQTSGACWDTRLPRFGSSALDERPDGRGLDQLALPEERHGLAGGLHGVAG